jgi:nucleotide-binding universal stress UspA family protein
MSLYERIVVGVDGSAAGVEALDQATRLLAPGGSLLGAVVCDLSVALQGGPGGGAIVEQLQRDAVDVKAETQRALAGVENAETRVIEGSPAGGLLALAEAEHATLVAVGSHGRSRAAGILLGGVATTLLHEAPCAVLVARPPDEPDAFPQTIVAGVDGSPQSLAAAEVAAELAERFDASLQLVVATEGKAVDADGLAAIQSLESPLLAVAGSRASRGPRGSSLHAPVVDRIDQSPVEALLAASLRADLLVVGSRGRHGLGALGSVSERVGHRARCSVLVVRGR